MKRVFLFLAPVGLLILATGCDQIDLPPGLDSTIASKLVSVSKPLLVGDQIQDRDRLMDGSCTGDGSQYRYGDGGGSGGSGGSGGAGGGGGGQGDQLRLRDGSCGDGG